MIFTKTKLDGVYIISPRVFTDSRGYFFESYNKKEFEENGLFYDFVQDNQSFSSYGTIRGLHFQKGQSAQAKLVRVIKGEVLDVAVDIRKNSPTYGEHVAVHLSEENQKEIHELLVSKNITPLDLVEECCNTYLNNCYKNKELPFANNTNSRKSKLCWYDY